MAHAGKDTGGSQFFMVLSEQNTRHLNGVHTVFGKVTGGLDVMKQIKKNDVMTKVRVSHEQRTQPGDKSADFSGLILGAIVLFVVCSASSG